MLQHAGEVCTGCCSTGTVITWGSGSLSRSKGRVQAQRSTRRVASQNRSESVREAAESQ